MTSIESTHFSDAGRLIHSTLHSRLIDAQVVQYNLRDVRYINPPPSNVEARHVCQNYATSAICRSEC